MIENKHTKFSAWITKNSNDNGNVICLPLNVMALIVWEHTVLDFQNDRQLANFRMRIFLKAIIARKCFFCRLYGCVYTGAGESGKQPKWFGVARDLNKMSFTDKE